MKSCPMRMCIVCRQMKPKKELLRIVHTANDEYKLDNTGKMNGRGAYICNSNECIAKCAKTKALNRAFKTNIDQEVYATILEEYENIKN